MGNRVNLICKCHFVLAVIVPFLFSSSLYAQNSQNKRESIANLSKKVSWPDKNLTSSLERISNWEEIEKHFNDSIAVQDSLKKIIERDKRTKATLIKRQNELHRYLANTFAERKGTQTEQMCFQCDTTILLLHQGMYGNALLDRKQEALLTFFRVKEYLSIPFEEKRVANARQILESQVSTEFPSEYTKIDEFLGQYGNMTENLQDALFAANEIRPQPDKTRAQHMTEKYKKEFFKELSKTLNPLLLSPTSYPYLYGILNEAIDAKMEDPSNDITEIIEKLKQQ